MLTAFYFIIPYIYGIATHRKKRTFRAFFLDFIARVCYSVSEVIINEYRILRRYDP